MGLLSIAFLLVAIVDFGILLWALKLCRQYRSNGLILSTVPLTLLWFDNLTIGLGGTLGEGDLLLAMNYVRFLAHYLALPVSIIAIGSMAREAGFAWAINRWFMGALCVLATWFIVHDLWLFWQADFYPSCFADTLRYTTRITEYTACYQDSVVGAGFAIPPIPAVSMSVMLIIFGGFLWRNHGWKWLTLCAVGAMGFFAVPYGSTGGIFSNIGEPIICSAIIATAAFTARLAQSRSGGSQTAY
jgi:hypothetical protein